MKHRFHLYLIATILWMCVIFWFSHQPKEDSSKMSGFVVELFTVLFQGNAFWIRNASFLVRKCAHMSEYAILAILFVQLYRNSSYFKYAVILSLISSFLYACSDEIHQLFVEGRAGMFQDVMIDTIGAIIALMIWHYVNLWFKRYKKRAALSS